MYENQSLAIYFGGQNLAALCFYFFTGLGNFRQLILSPFSLHLELVCILVALS
jgi:hypothetical protein